jgi:predicted DNA-binding transcriptional regulator AlpA
VSTSLDPTKDRAWTPEEVSTFLGVPVRTLYQWRYLGTGPKAARVGRHLRYNPAEVLAWFHQQEQAA